MQDRRYRAGGAGLSRISSPSASVGLSPAGALFFNFPDVFVDSVAKMPYIRCRHEERNRVNQQREQDMTEHMTLAGHMVKVDGDVWSIPSLVEDDGLLTTSTLIMRISDDGVACNPYTSGHGADQSDDNTISIVAGDKLL